MAKKTNVIKWSSSLILTLGMCLTALNIYPINLYFQIVGITGWLWVGLIWADYSLVFVNSVGVLILVYGIVISW